MKISFHFPNLLGCWSLSQPLSGKGGVHHEQVTSLLQGHIRMHTKVIMSHQSTNEVYVWTVGGHQRKPSHAQGQHATPQRKKKEIYTLCGPEIIPQVVP